MAESDFTIITDDGVSPSLGTIMGGLDGTEQLHSALSNPLTEHGTYCRKFFQSDGETSLYSRSTLFKANSISAIPNTKRISLRIRARQVNASGNPAVYLVAKARDFGAPNEDEPQGYCFSMGLGAGATVGATASNFTLRWRSQVNDGAGRGGTGNLQAYNYNSWYAMRIDVWYDAGNTRDVIECYTYEGTAARGNEIWNLIHTEYISTGDARYVPWGNVLDTVAWGYYVHQPWAAGGYDVYVDDFELFLSDV